MIRETILDIFCNYFLHIQVNTLNLPYYKLPRPYKSNKVSKLLRKIFETRDIRKIFGANIAVAMMVIPLLNGQSQPTLEPELSIEASQLAVSPDNPPITTQTRQYELPVERLRYISTYFKSGHPGYDLNSYVGDEVRAFTAGRVHYIENGTLGLGRYIILDHGNGLTSVYAHLKDFSVEVGQTVDAGEKIGEVGMTGYTTGPHLHFEIYDNGRAVNPRTYLGI